jgi:hypothetical protein
MKLWIPLLSLATATLGLSSAPRPAPGPGGILAMHKELFAAIDRGDGEAAGAFVAGDRKVMPRTPTLFLDVDAGGADAPLKAADAEEARELLARLAAGAKRSGGGWTTTITSEQADCYASELSYAVLEFERAHTVDGKTEVRRYRSTSLVRYESDHWRIFHWHVSRAGAMTGPAAR